MRKLLSENVTRAVENTREGGTGKKKEARRGESGDKGGGSHHQPSWTNILAEGLELGLQFLGGFPILLGEIFDELGFGFR